MNGNDIEKAITAIRRKIDQEMGGPVHHDIVRRVIMDVLFAKQSAFITEQISSWSPTELMTALDSEISRDRMARSRHQPTVVHKIANRLT
jgi:hypothetical protein